MEEDGRRKEERDGLPTTRVFRSGDCVCVCVCLVVSKRARARMPVPGLLLSYLGLSAGARTRKAFFFCPSQLYEQPFLL